MPDEKLFSKDYRNGMGNETNFHESIEQELQHENM
jgi:hypothetical protein